MRQFVYASQSISEKSCAGRSVPARVRVLASRPSLQRSDLYKYTRKSDEHLVRSGAVRTDLRVGALDVDGLQINVQAHYKGVPAFGAALQLMGCDGQGGGAAHGLQQAQAALLAQQRVHAELAQAHRPREGVAWMQRGR